MNIRVIEGIKNNTTYVGFKYNELDNYATEEFSDLTVFFWNYWLATSNIIFD